ncbi:hypothetical protein BHE74_00054441 [Ensete ventricosum]|nr:hypothetical protein BHE74_00054441 [Ensete ventricosum]
MDLDESSSLNFHLSKHIEERGQPTTVRPYVGVVGHDQAPYKGGWPWPGHLQGGGRLWPRPPAKGRSAAAKAPLHRGWQPLAGTTAYSATSIRGGRQRPARKGKLLAASLKRATPTTSPQGAAAHGQGCRQ